MQKTIETLSTVQYNMIFNLIERNPEWRVDDYLQFIRDFHIIEDGSDEDVKTIIKGIQLTIHKDDNILND